MKSTADMHPFYRVFFLKLDPLIMICSAYRNIFSATSAVDMYYDALEEEQEAMYINNNNDNYYNYYNNNIYHDPYTSRQQVFALITALATMAALLQHYSDDYNLWRIVQLVLLVWNFTFFNQTTCWMLSWWWRADDDVKMKGRWRPVRVEDVYCMEVLTLVILVRMAFLVGAWTRGRRVIKNGVLYDAWI
ncbi:hypothetical protein A9Z42_0024200 [Trichoderma parareesei]|uniref:Uncharacterized protein n=1 Tax=Trichoderma parareesei TaxID=858221 RepID=A0A2H2ZS13_TRIPA|nr:hypothetical protein A9Z42_0024200 [Trichoderma parareesei]